MMKKLVVLSIISLFALAVFSQENVKLGEAYKVIDAGSKLYFEKGKTVITIKIAGSGIYLQKLDLESLSEVSVKQYTDFPKGALLERILELNGKLYFFFSVWNKEQRAEQLFYREIDVVKGEFQAGAERILKLNEELAGSFSFGVGIFDKFNFYYSGDSTKVLIQYRLKPEHRNDDISFDKIGFCVLDASMTIKWHKVVKMPYTEAGMDNVDYVVDADENVYILAKVYKEHEDKNNPDYHMELLKLAPNGEKFQKFKITLNDKFVRNLRLYDDKSNNLLCAGFYYNTEKYTGSDGIMLVKIDKSSFQMKTRYYEIPLSVISKYESSRTVKKATKKDAKDGLELTNIFMDDVRVLDDGSVLLISEQYFITTTSYVDSNGNYHTKTYYNYYDIYLFKLDANLDVQWMQKIPKAQKGSTAPGSMSYKYFEGQNTHTFVIFDNIKNEKLINGVSPELYPNAKAYVYYFTVDDKTGELMKYKAFNTLGVNGIKAYQYSTKRIFKGPGNSFVMEVYKKKKEDILIKVETK